MVTVEQTKATKGTRQILTVLPVNPGWFQPTAEYPASRGVTMQPISKNPALPSQHITCKPVIIT